MIPLPGIPWYWKLGAVALAGLALYAWAYLDGRDSKQSELDALERSHAEAFARASGAARERERINNEAMAVAGRKWDEHAKIAGGKFDTALDRLRRAYASRDGVPRNPETAGQCPEPSGPAAAELLRQGETIAGIARDADLDRAALMACVSAWPR